MITILMKLKYQVNQSKRVNLSKAVKTIVK
jgi:hypothetical protein